MMLKYAFCVSFFFFFSSRRRHTRWPRDWSSDCALPISGGLHRPPRHRRRTDRLAMARLHPRVRVPHGAGGAGGGRPPAGDSRDIARAVAHDGRQGGGWMSKDHPNHKWWTLFAMCFALFMIMLDNTVVNVALPTI